jgi:hypothetical protein
MYHGSKLIMKDGGYLSPMFTPCQHPSDPSFTRGLGFAYSAAPSIVSPTFTKLQNTGLLLLLHPTTEQNALFPISCVAGFSDIPGLRLFYFIFFGKDVFQTKPLCLMVKPLKHSY